MPTPLKRLVLFLLLTFAAAGLPESGAGLYPPDGVVLLQHSPQVTLRWKLPQGEFTGELWSEGRKLQESRLSGSSWTVQVRPGGKYGWILRKGREIYSQGSFSLANQFSFSADGRNGAPGHPGPDGGPGQAGSGGEQVEAELRRDEAGMHLRIHTRNDDLHYLFAEPGLHFLITAKGGDGGRGADGDEFAGPNLAKGRDGGEAGWGGTLKIRTSNAPWRDYLEVDLSPGTPGAGGKGRQIYFGANPNIARDGYPGRPGQPGRIETLLGD